MVVTLVSHCSFSSQRYGDTSFLFSYEIYLKMAQNCCERERTTWPDMHSNFKMAQIFFPFVLGHFEVWTPKWPQTLKWPQTSKWPQFPKWPKLQNGPKRKGKNSWPFWSLNAYQFTWSYLFHSSFGPFEVYLVFFTSGEELKPEVTTLLVFGSPWKSIENIRTCLEVGTSSKYIFTKWQLWKTYL